MGVISDFFKKYKFRNEKLQNLSDSIHSSLNDHERAVFEPLKIVLFEFYSLNQIEINTPNMSEEEQTESNIQIMKFNKYIGGIQVQIRNIFLKSSHKVGFWTDIDKKLDKVVESHSLRGKIEKLENVLISILEVRKELSKIKSKKQAA